MPQARLVIRTQPNGAHVGAALVVQPIVAVLDNRDRPITSFTIPVTAELTAGSGAILGTVTVDTRDGVAQFTDLRLTGNYGARVLTFSAPGVTAASSRSVVLSPPLRSGSDRPDDIVGPQVHVVYALPFGAPDRGLDTNVAIANSVAALQAWLARMTDLQIRFDLYEGVLDVSFIQLSRSDDDVKTGYPVREIESQLAASGRLVPSKRYLVYYDGGSPGPCGGAAWPPLVPGLTAAMYLRACDVPFPTGPGGTTWYWEFAALHDLIHTLGVVSHESPHHTSNSPGHVPEPQDLMYGGGTAPWQLGSATVVDVGQDDYFGLNLTAGSVDLAASPFVTRATVASAGAPAIPLFAPLLNSMLPPHQPFPPR